MDNKSVIKAFVFATFAALCTQVSAQSASEPITEYDTLNVTKLREQREALRIKNADAAERYQKKQAEKERKKAQRDALRFKNAEDAEMYKKMQAEKEMRRERRRLMAANAKPIPVYNNGLPQEEWKIFNNKNRSVHKGCIHEHNANLRREAAQMNRKKN